MDAFRAPASGPIAAFQRAISRAGNQSELARICGCTSANISQLVKARKPLSPQFVLKVEAATGISRHDLRPDLYPREPAPQSASPPAAEDAPASPTSASPSPSGDEADDGRGVDLRPGGSVS